MDNPGNINIVTLFRINVREYRRGHQKWTIQGNWQHRVHKTKKTKTKTQLNMCWTSLKANKHILNQFVRLRKAPN